jgi:hypothetical protein
VVVWQGRNSIPALSDHLIDLLTDFPFPRRSLSGELMVQPRIIRDYCGFLHVNGCCSFVGLCKLSFDSELGVASKERGLAARTRLPRA